MTFTAKYWIWAAGIAIALSIVSANPANGLAVLLLAAIARSVALRIRDRRSPDTAPMAGSATSEPRLANRPATSPQPPHEPRPTATPPRQAPAIPSLPPFELVGAGAYANTEVEGEFARIDAITRVVGRAPRVEEELVLERIPVQLIPEPSNRYDRNAVMVVAGHEHIGYLPRAVAADYAEPLQQITAAGYAPQTWARIWVVTRRDWQSGGTKTHANVRVALADAQRLVPVNDPPTRPYSLLPWAGAVQVTGEEKHLEVLSEYVDPERPVTAIATLHETEATSRTGSKSIVEVCIDGQTIGTLTPQMGQNFLPTIRHLLDQSLTTAAWLTIKGSAIAVQATLQAPKAHDLPSDWLATAHTIPALHARPEPPQPDVRPEPMWED